MRVPRECDAVNPRNRQYLKRDLPAERFVTTQSIDVCVSQHLAVVSSPTHAGGAANERQPYIDTSNVHVQSRRARISV